MTKAVFPGSFDPFTLGHLDIVRRATGIFDEVVIAVATNSGKTPLLSLTQRLEIISDAVAEIPGVSVGEVPGLLVDFCAQQQASAIVKGLRGGSDLDGETPMALMNRHLSGIDTVFLVASPTLAHVASSMVRDVARFGGDVSTLLTPLGAQALQVAFAKG